MRQNSLTDHLPSSTPDMQAYPSAWKPLDDISQHCNVHTSIGLGHVPLTLEPAPKSWQRTPFLTSSSCQMLGAMLSMSFW